MTLANCKIDATGQPSVTPIEPCQVKINPMADATNRSSIGTIRLNRTNDVPHASIDVGPEDIRQAARAIAGHVLHTPCPPSPALSDLTGASIFCKLDYLQRTGSFKERGACNALLHLKASNASIGAITASAGNHALALAYHGQRLGIPVTVVMPRHAPLVKAENSRKLGAQVILYGESFPEAREHARTLAQARGLTYVHGFDDPHVIAGAGTAGLEALADVPDADAIIVPVGGGGLLAGVGLAVKSMKPDIEVIGVESCTMPGFRAAIDAGRPVDVTPYPTLADGLAVGRVGERAFAIGRRVIDRHVVVDESEIARAILRLIELEKAVVEGAAAATLAALFADHLPDLKGRRVILMLCGGNIDPLLLSSVIERGLVADDRILRFTASISDRPGGLARLTQSIADSGATILEINHDRAFSGDNAFQVNVDCRVGVRDRNHAESLLASLRKHWQIQHQAHTPSLPLA